MEVVVSIVSAIAGEAGRSCFVSLCSTIRRAREFDLNDWEFEMNNLLVLRNCVIHQVESAEVDGRLPAAQVKTWLREVDKFEIKANPVLAAMRAEERRRCGCFVQFRLRWKAAKMLKTTELLLISGSFPAGLLSNNYLTKAVEYMPGPSIEDQTTASRTLADLLKKLDDDRIHRIGVWGMGGVGKTTLIKNLNNKLGTCSTQPFSIVIWATVSKELDLKNVQKQIAERLKMEVSNEDSVERTARRLYQRLAKEIKFLLILDDIWKKLDLDCLGIPQPEAHEGSKIILTSRFSEVCREMMTDDNIKVNVLNNEEAWRLFSQKAREVVNLERISPFATAVARECCGLPLALITVGTAMRNETRLELWKHALKNLQRSVPRIGGIKDAVYNPLKLSYDSLEGNDIKTCFLYCALFPEDFSIKNSELVQYWLAEGLIDELQNFEDSINDGIAMIEKLKDAGLLEDGDREGSVKMHDVVRDVAIWIAASLENECKSLSRCGIGWSEIQAEELSNSLKRVSFAYNKIEKLPDYGTQCSKVSTLLLQDNLPLKEVPEKFLQGFESLRVLNISRTNIQSLPPLLQLTDLRALLLADCFALKELPLIGALSGLLFLDLCATRIRELPKEMENLIHLRHVDLSYTANLKRIQAGIMSKWTYLAVLEMKHSGFRWRRKDEVEEGQANLEDLRGFKRLLSLSIILGNNSSLSLEDITWIDKVRRFELFVGPNPAVYSVPTGYDERRVTISSPLATGLICWSIVNPSSLVLKRCDVGLDEMLQDLAASTAISYSHRKSAGSFAGLRSLSITNCSLQTGEQRAAASDSLPNLEELCLDNLTGLESISQSFGHLGLKFPKLKSIEASRCLQMKCLLSYGDFILTLPCLETIKVSFCYNLEELFHLKKPLCELLVPKLRKLELKSLPRLRNLCGPEESWPSLEQVEVVACHLLTRLPLTFQNANTIKEIRGESLWWSTLEMDDENTKSTLQQYFRAYWFQSRQAEEKHISTSVLPDFYEEDKDPCVGEGCSNSDFPDYWEENKYPYEIQDYSSPTENEMFSELDGDDRFNLLMKWISYLLDEATVFPELRKTEMPSSTHEADKKCHSRSKSF